MKTTFDQPEPDEHGQFDPADWRTLGFSAADGRKWWEQRITPAAALRWQHVGVTVPLDAVRWRMAGVDVVDVRGWTAAGIDAREVVAWTELGFDAVESGRHKRAGLSPATAYAKAPETSRLPGPGPSVTTVQHGSEMHRFMQAVGRHRPLVARSYMHRQWTDDEALAWASHGIEATEALAWKELGLTPVEAGRQQEHGQNAMQTAKAWWQAGIPVEEVADWIGAGLTPKEAAEQRAGGVTVEQAAVLRSLRKEK